MTEVRVFHKDNPTQEKRYLSPTLPTNQNGATISTVLNNFEACNFLTFDGKGVDLTESGLKFFEEGDYTGCALQYISNADCEISNLSNNANAIVFKKTALGGTYPTRLSIKFKDLCCSEIQVVYKRQNGDIDNIQTLVIDKDFVTIELTQGFYRVEIHFTRSVVPKQYVRFETIIYGNIFSLDRFTNIGLIEEINVLSDDLPINQLDLTVVNNDETELEISRKDRLVILNGSKNYGTFFVTECKRTGKNIYDIVAQNLVGVLENEQYPDWTSNQLTILQDFVQTLNPNITVAAKTDYTLFGYLPIVSKRHALCAAAWGCGFMVDGSRSDKIRLKKIPTEISSTILTSDRRIIGDAVLERSDPIYSANIVYPYQMDFITEEISLTAPVNTVNYHLWNDAPIKIDSASGNVVFYSESDNYVEYKAENETIAFSVTKYKYSNSVETVINPMVLADDIDEGETKEYKDFQISGGFYDERDWVESISRAADVQKYIQSRGIVKAKIVLYNERPGDLIQIETAWDGIITGIITKMNISFGYDDVAEIEVLEWSI